MITTFLLGYFIGISTYSLISQLLTHKDETPELGGFGGLNRGQKVPPNRTKG